MVRISERNIFIIDKEQRVCEVVREALEDPDTKVTCFVHAAECLEQLPSQQCDLLIADLKMPEMNGIELIRSAKHIAPWLAVLIIADHGDIQTAVKVIKAGAVDLIEKPLVKEHLVRKVKSILQQSASSNADLGKSLTRSEMRVLKLVIDGKSNTEIANLLHRSKRTIEWHRAHFMHKLGADNLIDLVKRAVAMGLAHL